MEGRIRQVRKPPVSLRSARAGRQLSCLATVVAAVILAGCAATPGSSPHPTTPPAPAPTTGPSATSTPSLTPSPTPPPTPSARPTVAGSGTATGSAAPTVGPPYPSPDPARVVHDNAGIFSTETISSAETSIRAIQARTGAEIVVYTQLRPGATTASTEADARALVDQWNVGGASGDGLVILWNLDETLVHGQVQLYAGAGFRLRVPNDELQAIFETTMRPLLAEQDLDGAMLAAIRRLEALPALR